MTFPSSLPLDPTVKIILQGHLILEPESDGSKCNVGISRCSPDHTFSIEVREKMKDGSAPDIIRMRNRGMLEPYGVRINLYPPSIEGIRMYTPGDFDRSYPNSDPNDFRWIVDLASREFHNNPLEVDGPGTQPRITIHDGLFYTLATTDPNLVKVTRTGGGLDPLPLYRIALLLGVNIYGYEVSLKFAKDGVVKELRMKRQPSTYYEVWINNDPSFSNPDPTDQELATHRELREYYRAINGLIVPDPEDPGVFITDPYFERFELQFERLRGQPGLGSPTIPCMPIGNGGG